MRKTLLTALDWSLDVAVFLLVAFEQGRTMLNLYRGVGWAELEVLFLGLIIILGTPVWIHTRVLPRIGFLANDIQWRRELAVTPIDAGRYLLSRLKVPILRSSAPFVVPLVGFFYLTVESKRGFEPLGVYVTLVALALTYALLGYLMLAIAARYIMKYQGTEGRLALRITMWFFIFLVVEGLYTFLAAFMMNADNGGGAVFAIWIAMLPVIVSSFFIIRRCVEGAGRSYLNVE